MDINHNLIKGCPLCDIFLDPKKHIHTKVYYPEYHLIQSSDFIILECETTKTPMVILRDHVASPSKTIWGNILQVCRHEFGYPLRLRNKPRRVIDHYSCYIILKKEY